MIATYSSWNKQPVEKLLSSLSVSNGEQPFNSRSVKMHEFKSEVIRYCNNFQEGKCKFGEKCRYKLEKDIIINNKNKNNMYDKNNKNKIPYRKNFNDNNYKNNNTAPQRINKNNEGRPQKYSNQNSFPLKKFNTIGNSAIQSKNNHNSNWLFSNNFASPNINPRMYVLKQITNTIPRTDINDHQPDIITNFITSDTTNNVKIILHGYFLNLLHHLI